MNKHKGFNQTKVYHAVRKRIDKQRYSRVSARTFSYIQQLGNQIQRFKSAPRNLETNVRNYFQKQKWTTKEEEVRSVAEMVEKVSADRSIRKAVAGTPVTSGIKFQKQTSLMSHEERYKLQSDYTRNSGLDSVKP